MEFLADYASFLAKTVTLVIAIVVVLVAAEQAGQTPSAVSRTLSRLEAKLGTTLIIPPLACAQRQNPYYTLNRNVYGSVGHAFLDLPVWQLVGCQAVFDERLERLVINVGQRHVTDKGIELRKVVS